jgi:succinate-semialdehyde dehydrogenase/glutarate-semialdehyde dehydrogenase
MLEHLDDLALLLTLEQGKPLAESVAEIRYAASFLEWFGEEGKRGTDAPLGAGRRRARRGGRPRAGVFSVVTGDAEDAPVIGAELTSSPLVRKVGFTGSNEVGKRLMAQCAAGLKKISLELGRNAPFVVFDDADLDEALAGTLLNKYRNSGQTCITANRILVQDGVYDEYVERLVDGVTRLTVGAGMERGRDLGRLDGSDRLEPVTAQR